MQTSIRTAPENTSSASQLYTLAGIGAIAFVVLNVASITFSDWTNPAAANPASAIFGALAYAVLLPVVFTVCRHLRPASASRSAIALVAGVVGLITAATGVVAGYDSTIGMISGIPNMLGLLVFFGLAGYLALSSKLLPAGWAFLSILLGILVLGAGTISIVAGATAAETALAWTAVAVLSMAWAIWTAIEFMGRGRAASAGA